LKSDLQRITTDSKYIELHQGGTQVINEQAIIISDKEVKRPDKIIVKENETVIIDYKTGLKDAKHQRQVKNYCAILSEMQFPNVKGYILYTQDLEFVTC
jgi:CRISPR/Cas system-associated exonuclease Cas4 (RecB family)